MAASLERRDADARDEFERALELDPKLTQARALLGQIQYRMGERELAVRTYETLVAHDARRSRRAGDARALAARGRSARSHGAGCRFALHRLVRRADGGRARGRGARAARSRLLAHQPAVRQLSGGADRRGALHQRAVPRHHARAGVGSRRLRRHHPGADARRAREARGARSRALARVHARADPIARLARRADLAERRTRHRARDRRTWSGPRNRRPRCRRYRCARCSPASAGSPAGRRSWPTRRAPSPRAGCSTRRAALPSPTCCAISARASTSRPPSSTASSGRSPNSRRYTDDVSDGICRRLARHRCEATQRPSLSARGRRPSACRESPSR